MNFVHFVYQKKLALKSDSELNSCLPVLSRSLFAIVNEL
jgi:hypothetical protein